MKPINFDGQNVVFGEKQPEYQPLPTRLETDGNAITCWELEPGDLEKIQETGKIWFSQLTFFDPLQPILPMAEQPEFKKAVEVKPRIDNVEEASEMIEKVIEKLDEPKEHIEFKRRERGD